MPAQTRNQRTVDKSSEDGSKVKVKQLLLGEAAKIKEESKRIKKPEKFKSSTKSAVQIPKNGSKLPSKVKKPPHVSKTKSTGNKSTGKKDEVDGKNSGKQLSLKDVGAAKLLDSIDLNKVLDKKADVKKNAVKIKEKFSQNSPPKFKPGDKIELTSPKQKGIEIAKSVREPNNRLLQADNGIDRPSERPSDKVDKKQRADAIQKLKSRTARLVAQDSSRRPVQINQEKPRELTKRPENQVKAASPDIQKKPLQQQPTNNLAQGKALIKSRLIDLIQGKSRSTIIPQTQPTKSKSVENQTKTEKVEKLATTQQITKEKREKSLEEEAKKANISLDEYLLFRDDDDRELVVKTESRQSSPEVEEVQPKVGAKRTNLKRAGGESQDPLVGQASKKQKAEPKQELKNTDKVIFKQEKVDIEIYKKQLVEPKTEPKILDKVKVELEKVHLEKYKAVKKEVKIEKVVKKEVKKETDLKKEEPELKKESDHTPPTATRGRRGAKQTEKLKPGSPLKFASPEKKRLVQLNELRTLEKVITKVESRIENQDDLDRFSKRAKAFIKYVSTLPQKK